MRWLVVGAGAVGQVMASHAARGGAQVAFKVRDARRVERPFRLMRLGIGRAPRVAGLDAEVFDRDDQVRAFAPDVVVLTVPSDALAGAWLGSLLAAAGSASIVAMEPGAQDAALVTAAAPGRPLTRGIVAFIAYQSPLPGTPAGAAEERGISYWAPRLAPCPFEGPAAAAIAATLRAGGLAATERSGIEATAAYGSAVMSLYVGSLRLAGWSFRDWRASESLVLAGRAAREAREVLADSGPAPRWLALLTPGTVWTGLALAARVLPLPLEPYLAYHFTKVGAQSLAHVGHLVALADAAGHPAPALRRLFGALSSEA